MLVTRWSASVIKVGVVCGCQTAIQTVVLEYIIMIYCILGIIHGRKYSQIVFGFLIREKTFAIYLNTEKGGTPTTSHFLQTGH